MQPEPINSSSNSRSTVTGDLEANTSYKASHWFKTLVSEEIEGPMKPEEFGS